MTSEFPQIFDPHTQEGNSWAPLPVGGIFAQIVEASVLQPKSGNGFYLALTWKIAEGKLRDARSGIGSPSCIPTNRHKRSQKL